MTSTAQSEEPLDGVAGLAFLGFPLHAPGKPSITRAEHLGQIQVPMLFLQGTRDEFAKLDLITEVTTGLGPRATLVLLQDADHSFKVPKRAAAMAAMPTDGVTGWLADQLVAWGASL
jgi:predicted alpha/beta-hydrolase family hydrolase